MSKSAKARIAAARRAEIRRQQAENYLKWWCNERLKDALWYSYLELPHRAFEHLSLVAQEVTAEHERYATAEKEARDARTTRPV